MTEPRGCTADDHRVELEPESMEVDVEAFERRAGIHGLIL